MYFRPAKRIECIRPSLASLTSSAVVVAAGRQRRPLASSLAEYRVRHNRGLPRPSAFQHLCLPSFRPVRGRLFGFRLRPACRGKGARVVQLQAFKCSHIRHRSRSSYLSKPHSLAIFKARLRAGQLPRDSGSFATGRSTGRIDPDTQSVGVFQPRQVVVHGLYGEVYETTDWIASTPPCRLGNGQSPGARFGRTLACSPCHARRVQVCSGRPHRPGDGAIAVRGHPPAQAEAQSDFRCGVEGAV
jgi:hypothetical protein